MKHALVLFALVAVVACGAPQEMADEATTGKLTVVATTTIVADAVRQIAGDSVEVVALMGAGVDPHLYKPSAGDVRRLSSADAVFSTGCIWKARWARFWSRSANAACRRSPSPSASPRIS
jgi:manganese/zinc/iron transport system substrate-binding protein